MKEKFTDKDGILRCIEGSEEYVKKLKRKYGTEKKIIKIKPKEEIKNGNSSTRKLEWVLSDKFS